MSDETNVTVSAGELAMLTDKNIILTKRAVQQKASALFSSLVPAVKDIYSKMILPYPELAASVPKISRGENYRGFPYVILDYPAVFEKENIFALRTMFWWGNFFSITLHLSGGYKNIFADKIFNHLAENPDIFIATGEDEWAHHFEEDNYQLYATCSGSQKIKLTEKKFIKIALRYELADWNRMQEILPEGYKVISKCL